MPSLSAAPKPRSHNPTMVKPPLHVAPNQTQNPNLPSPLYKLIFSIKQGGSLSLYNKFEKNHLIFHSSSFFFHLHIHRESPGRKTHLRPPSLLPLSKHALSRRPLLAPPLYQPPRHPTPAVPVQPRHAQASHQRRPRSLPRHHLFSSTKPSLQAHTAAMPLYFAFIPPHLSALSPADCSWKLGESIWFTDLKKRIAF